MKRQWVIAVMMVILALVIAGPASAQVICKAQAHLYPPVTATQCADTTGTVLLKGTFGRQDEVQAEAEMEAEMEQEAEQELNNAIENELQREAAEAAQLELQPNNTP